MNIRDFRQGRCIAVFETRTDMEAFIARCGKLGMGFGRERSAALPDEVVTDADAMNRGIACDGHDRLYFNKLVKVKDRLKYRDVVLGKEIVNG